MCGRLWGTFLGYLKENLVKVQGKQVQGYSVPKMNRISKRLNDDDDDDDNHDDVEDDDQDDANIVDEIYGVIGKPQNHVQEVPWCQHRLRTIRLFCTTTRTLMTKETFTIALGVRSAGEQVAARLSQLCQRVIVFI